MKFLNTVSLATAIAALINIFVVVFLSDSTASYVSAIFAWIVVITTQLSLISVRLKK